MSTMLHLSTITGEDMKRQRSRVRFEAFGGLNEVGLSCRVSGTPYF